MGVSVLRLIRTTNLVDSNLESRDSDSRGLRRKEGTSASPTLVPLARALFGVPHTGECRRGAAAADGDGGGVGRIAGPMVFPTLARARRTQQARTRAPEADHGAALQPGAIWRSALGFRLHVARPLVRY